MFSKKQILSIFTIKKRDKNKALREKIIKDLNLNFDNKFEAKEFLEELINFYNKEYIL